MRLFLVFTILDINKTDVTRNINLNCKNMTVKLVEKLDIGLERRKKNYFIFAKTKIFRTTHFRVLLCLCHFANCIQYTTLSVWFT